MVGDGENIGAGRNHLFISYATEDVRFSDWLCLKLAAEGYALWYDRYKLLGGESYPQSIDDAIKNRTFRMIAVLSRSSIKKENPVAERTLGHNICRERKIDFVIPINLDGLKSTELDWQSSPISYVPFSNGWASGFNQLLRKLKSIEAPKALTNAQLTVSKSVADNDVILPGKEVLYSNILTVESFPRKVKCFTLTTQSTESGLEPLGDQWAFYYLGNKILSFTEPSDSIMSDYALKPSGSMPIDTVTIFDVPTKNIVQNLIYKSVGVKCYEKGLLPIQPREGSFYFPYEDKDWLKFVDFNGDERRRQASGNRTAKSTLGRVSYHWHLAPRFKVLPRAGGEYNLFINIGAYVTDMDGTPCTKRVRNARVKKVTKDWWNDRILEYQMAIAQLLADNKDKIVIGINPDEQVIISNRFITNTLMARVNDDSSINQELPSPEDELTDISEEDDECEEEEG